MAVLHDGGAEEVQENESVAAEEATGENSGSPIDLTELPQFRQYQSKIDKKLQEAQEAARRAAEEAERVKAELEALKAGREYDTKLVNEVTEKLKVEKMTKERINDLLAAWGDTGLQDNAEYMARLQGASTPEEADSIVYEFLRERVSSGQRRDELRDTGVDQTAVKESVGSDKISDLIEEYSKDAMQGRDRLLDVLMATEPVFNTGKNVPAKSKL